MASFQTFESETRSWKPESFGLYPTQFAESIDLDSDWMAIGSFGHPDEALFPSLIPVGKVEMYRRTPSGWVHSQDIFPKEPWLGGQFGNGIAISGTQLFIGEPGYGFDHIDFHLDGRGHMYELNGDTWEYSQGIRVASPYGESQRFGEIVEMDNDWLVVGHYEGVFDPNVDVAGAVYCYKRNPGGGWSLAQRIPAPMFAEAGVSNYLSFGYSLALQGDKLLVSAPTGEGGGVFLYRLVNGVWVLERTFEDPYGTSWVGEYVYGRSMAIDGERVAISAVSSDGAAVSPFADMIHFFERVNGVWEDKGMLFPPGPGQGLQDWPHFGFSIAMEDGWLFVGSPGGRESEAWSIGRCDLFKRDSAWNWSLVETFRHSDRLVGSGMPGAHLGESVAADFTKGTLLAAAPNYRGSLVDSTAIWGGAYLFDLELGDSYCGGTVNSTGEVAGLSMLGSPEIGLGNLIFHGHHLPPGEFALCLYGQTSAPVAVQTGGSLCILGGYVTRLFPAIPIGAGGEIFHSLDFQAPLNVQHLQQGTTWGFQIWHRDHAGGASVTGTSEAIRLSLE